MENNVIFEKAVEYKLSVVQNENNFDSKQLKSSQESADYCRQFYYDDIDIYESFFIVLLNRSCHVRAWVKISQGGMNATVVDSILVLKYMIDSLSKNVILCHNHPGGSLVPSEQDLKLTKKIKELVTLMDCSVLDHIILTSTNYYSFADNGIL